MPRGHSSPQPPDPADDPALDYALAKLEWYERARNRSRRMHQSSELLILVTTASTVVIAALHAPAALTASAAAASLFLTGIRQVFKPNELRVDYTMAALKLEQTIAEYRLVPEADRDSAARRDLLDRVVEITSVESRAWADRTRGEPATRAPARTDT